MPSSSTPTNTQTTVERTVPNYSSAANRGGTSQPLPNRPQPSAGTSTTTRIYRNRNFPIRGHSSSLAGTNDNIHRCREGLECGKQQQYSDGSISSNGVRQYKVVVKPFDATHYPAA